jgi:hypothetical protein
LIDSKRPQRSKSTPGSEQNVKKYRFKRLERKLPTIPPKQSSITLTGNLMQLEGDFHRLRGNPNPPKRENCKTFSRASRLRMIKTVASLGDATPIFVTLTYGKTWSENPKDWKRHLNHFLTSLKYHYPQVSAIWKLEPQRRGAPHYHLLIYHGRIDKNWLAINWAKATKDTSTDHINAGTRVEKLRSARGAAYYCSKYMTKASTKELPEYWSRAGRWWGIYNKKALPVAPIKSVAVSELAMRSMLEFIRNKLTERVIARQTKTGEPLSPEEIHELRTKPWQAPSTLCIDPENFFSEFYAFLITKYPKMIASSRTGSENSKKAQDEWLKKHLPWCDKELDKIAKIC